MVEKTARVISQNSRYPVWVGLIFGLTLFSCTTVPQELNPDIFYQRDMELDINGFRGVGTLVVPKDLVYKLKIKARGRLDMFTFTSCHRDISEQDAGDKRLFGQRRHYEMDYVPNPGIEDDGFCAVELGGYEIERGRHSWAFIDFESEDEQLPGLIKCNGSSYNATGVSICQSRFGLIQEISFPEPVFHVEHKCAEMKSSDSKTFRYKMKKGRCVIRFMTKQGKQQTHRHTMIGYESILIRRK